MTNTLNPTDASTISNEDSSYCENVTLQNQHIRTQVTRCRLAKTKVIAATSKKKNVTKILSVYKHERICAEKLKQWVFNATRHFSFFPF